MLKKLLIILFILIIIAGAVFYFLVKGVSLPNFIPTDDSLEKEMIGKTPQEDQMIKELGDKEIADMKNASYQYVGELLDVTKGEVRGINAKGEASGTAKSNFDGEMYSLMAAFEGIPEPSGDDFYEGWIVQKDPFMFLSTGIVRKMDGVYANIYKSGQDLTNYNFYVLTIEPNNGDPSPADHIVEGTMK